MKTATNFFISAKICAPPPTRWPQDAPWWMPPAKQICRSTSPNGAHPTRRAIPSTIPIFPRLIFWNSSNILNAASVRCRIGFSPIFSRKTARPMTPFHGGFGLLTLQGVKKPAYFAFQFLNRLGATELKNYDDASWVCRDEKGGAQILLWDLTRPDRQVGFQPGHFPQIESRQIQRQCPREFDACPAGKLPAGFPSDRFREK